MIYRKSRGIPTVLCLLIALSFLYSWADQIPILIFDGNLDVARLEIMVLNVLAIFLAYYFSKIKISIKKIDYFPGISNKQFLESILWLLIIISLFFGLSNGTLENGMFNRINRDIFVNFYEGSLWAYVKLLMISCSLLIIYINKTNKKNLILKFSLLLLIIGFIELGIFGGRRILVNLFLPIIFLLMPVMSLRVLIFLSIIFLVMFLFGSYREVIFHNQSDVPIEEILFSAIASNEFQVVSSGITDYINLGEKYGYLFGASYFELPSMLFNYIGGIQNISLGRSYGIFIGLFSEAIINFSIFYFPFLVFIFFLVFKLTKLENFLSLIMTTFIVELFRTSFTEFMINFIIVFLFSGALVILSNIIFYSFFVKKYR